MDIKGDLWPVVRERSLQGCSTTSSQEEIRDRRPSWKEKTIEPIGKDLPGESIRLFPSELYRERCYDGEFFGVSILRAIAVGSVAQWRSGKAF